MDIVLIAPANLRGVWPFVRKGLDTLPPDHWIAEDVYHALKVGESALHLAVGASGPCGFMVLRRLVDEFDGEVRLHVWIAYNEGESDVLEAGVGILRETAKRMGAQRITFTSPRKGWAKRYAPKATTYEIPTEGSA